MDRRRRRTRQRASEIAAAHCCALCVGPPAHASPAETASFASAYPRNSKAPHCRVAASDVPPRGLAGRLHKQCAGYQAPSAPWCRLHSAKRVIPAQLLRLTLDATRWLRRLHRDSMHGTACRQHLAAFCPMVHSEVPAHWMSLQSGGPQLPVWDRRAALPDR